MAIPKFFKNNGGNIQEAEVGVQISTADSVVVTGADGKISSTFFPTDFAKDIVDTYSTGPEALVAGDLVNVYNDSGTARVRKADASNGRDAHGFVLSSYGANISGTVVVYFEGNNTSMSGMTVGKQWLSATQPGKTTTTPPSGVGHLVQVVGFASSATNMNFQCTNPFYLA